MKNKYKKEELEIFGAFYKSLRNNFPRFCGSGHLFTCELDYNFRSHANKGHMDANLDENPEFYEKIFFRRCDVCDTTVILNLNSKGKKKRDFMFEAYTQKRAKREHKPEDIQEIWEEIREEYNEFLMEKEKDLILRPTSLYLAHTEPIITPLSKLKMNNVCIAGIERYAQTYSTIEKANIILDKNQDRFDMVIIEGYLDYFKDHEKIIEKIRKNDKEKHKHTNILLAGHRNLLREGYNQLRINGLIPELGNNKNVKRTIMDYLK